MLLGQFAVQPCNKYECFRSRATCLFLIFLHLQHNWNANLFHSHPGRSYSETFVSIKHWLFSEIQCCMEYSYPSGSGDSRSHSLPHSLQLRQNIKDDIQEKKSRNNKTIVLLERWLNIRVRKIVQPSAIGAQFF